MQPFLLYGVGFDKAHKGARYGGDIARVIANNQFWDFWYRAAAWSRWRPESAAATACTAAGCSDVSTSEPKPTAIGLLPAGRPRGDMVG